MRSVCYALLCGVAVVLAAPGLSLAEGSWGTIKGQVVWDGGDIPQPAQINVTKDQQVCLKEGPLFEEKFVIDKKTKGVRWVMVWLVDKDDIKAELPIHPALKQIKEKKVILDQPCCHFTPHVLGVREGQTVVAKNPATVPHNVNVVGGRDNPNLNQIIPPGQELDIMGFKASTSPVLVSCSIHTWMKGYIRVFKHPYFAVTDEQGRFEIPNAPAGDYRIVIWQEEAGWVKGDKTGTPITVKAEGVTDLRKIRLTPPKD
jgi:hypothetical protein